MYIRRASSPSTVLWAFHEIQPSSYFYVYCGLIHCQLCTFRELANDESCVREVR